MTESLLEILRSNAKESPETMAKLLGVAPEAVEAAVSRCNLSCVPGILDSIAKTSLDTRVG